MKTVFADSGFWIALLNPRDALHREADQLCSQFTSALVVTSEMVLTEVMNHFSESGDHLRRAASALVEGLCESPRCEVVPQTSDQFRNAARLYGQRHDKQWSLTDCSSILIMRAHDIGDALTYDKHFAQAGFTALLRE
jgi:predicted nucleic acid-binding protein